MPRKIINSVGQLGPAEHLQTRTPALAATLEVVPEGSWIQNRQSGTNAAKTRQLQVLYFQCRGRDLNPHGAYAPQDFKVKDSKIRKTLISLI